MFVEIESIKNSDRYALKIGDESTNMYFVFNISLEDVQFLAATLKEAGF